MIPMYKTRSPREEQRTRRFHREKRRIGQKKRSLGEEEEVRELSIFLSAKSPRSLRLRGEQALLIDFYQAIECLDAFNRDLRFERIGNVALVMGEVMQ